MPVLESLGWTDALAAAFQAHAAAGLVPGRVSLEHNHVYRVLTADGERLAEAAGRIKHLASGRDELPAVGDWVGLRVDPSGSRSVIRVILPRRSQFSRKAAGRQTREQVVAANIDTVFLVSGLDQPVNPRQIERYLMVARQSGARPVVVLNKTDLCGDVEAAVRTARTAATDAPVHALCARGEAGLDALAPYLVCGQTTALLGPSGAGKSSLVNALVGRHAQATGAVRDSDKRGRHTSVHRELIQLPGRGVVIDTPGLRELQVWDAAETADLDDAFADIAALSGTCRFRDCRHDQEPGCAVKAAVEAGGLSGGRYGNFQKLQQEREQTVRLQEERALADARRRPRATSSSRKTPDPRG